LLHLVDSSVLLYLTDDARSNKNQFFILLLHEECRMTRRDGLMNW